MNSTRLIIRITTFILVVGLCNLLLGIFGRHHFLPWQKMNAAIQKGSGCLVYVGDSRVQEAFDSQELEAALRARGLESCVADLSLGGVDPLGQHVILRKYLSLHLDPRLIIVGFMGGGLIDSFETMGMERGNLFPPEVFAGSEALVLLWSRPADVFQIYPGFPLAHFDSGLRFLINRTNSLSIYGSTIWKRVQAFQQALDIVAPAAPPPAENSTGARAIAMVAPPMALIGDHNRVIGSFVNRFQLPPNSPLRMIEMDAEKYGKRILFVQLPVPQSIRLSVLENPDNRKYFSWLSERALSQGHSFLDLSSPHWLSDEHFADAIHLNSEGRERFSRELAEKLSF